MRDGGVDRARPSRRGFQRAVIAYDPLSPGSEQGDLREVASALRAENWTVTLWPVAGHAVARLRRFARALAVARPHVVYCRGAPALAEAAGAGLLGLPVVADLRGARQPTLAARTAVRFTGVDVAVVDRGSVNGTPHVVVRRHRTTGTSPTLPTDGSLTVHELLLIAVRVRFAPRPPE